MNLVDVLRNAFTFIYKKAQLWAVSGGITVVALGLGYKFLLRPNKLNRVGVVSQLLIHPLKSGRAVSVALAECQPIGLKYGELRDRLVTFYSDFFLNIIAICFFYKSLMHSLYWSQTLHKPCQQQLYFMLSSSFLTFIARSNCMLPNPNNNK